MREFESGATRDAAEGKLAYHRFFSPDVLTAVAQYLERHRDTPNGRREPDNWKAGIPADVYVESLHRHAHELWTQFEHNIPLDMDTLCAIHFNIHGLIYEELRRRAC